MPEITRGRQRSPKITRGCQRYERIQVFVDYQLFADAANDYYQQQPELFGLPFSRNC